MTEESIPAKKRVSVQFPRHVTRYYTPPEGQPSVSYAPSPGGRPGDAIVDSSQWTNNRQRRRRSIELLPLL